jgi:hypothetical protein
LIPVYANLLSPPVADHAADRMASCLHTRGGGVEGYFEPLDGSIVLLRNLEVQGRTYLGTPHHEMVHALLAVDFPNAPAWLDEGLASLHEELDESDNPRNNYRLYYLVAPDTDALIGPLSSFLESTTPWSVDMYPVAAARARYFAWFLWSRPPGNGQKLAAIYARLRAKSTRAHGDSIDAVVQELQADSIAAVQKDFDAFLADRTRDPATSWEASRTEIFRWVGENAIRKSDERRDHGVIQAAEAEHPAVHACRTGCSRCGIRSEQTNSRQLVGLLTLLAVLWIRRRGRASVLS